MISDVLSVQALWHTVWGQARRRDWHFPQAVTAKSCGCLSPPGIAEVWFSVPAEFFLANIKKRRIIDCILLIIIILITYIQKSSQNVSPPKWTKDLKKIHIKCQTPSGTQTGNYQTFVVENLPVFPSDPSKYSMSNFRACKNTDTEPHPAINFKRKLTNEYAQRGTLWFTEGQGNTEAFTMRSLL